MTTEDTSGVSSSVCPVADTIACTDDGSDCAASASNDAAAPDRATSTMGASGKPSYIRAITDMTAYAGEGPGHAVFACDIAAVPSHVTSAAGTLATPSFVCSPMDTTIGRASVVSAMVPLLASSVAPVGS